MNINYYLVLEKRPGDYNYIDINRLNNNRYYTNNISDIDLFTLNYNENDLKELIEKANLVNEEYLNGKFFIVSDHHHHLDILTKDKFNIIKEFQNNNEIIEINLKNKLYGAYKKIIDKNFKDTDFKKELLDKFNTSLKNNNKQEVFTWLEKLPYENVRNFYFVIYNELS